jgi:hypothetical protein
VREQLGQAHEVVLQLVVLCGLELVVEEQVQGMGSNAHDLREGRAGLETSGHH